MKSRRTFARQLLVSWLLALGSIVSIYAQTPTASTPSPIAPTIIKGTVTDEDGAPLKSANVFVAKTTAGGLSNSKGEFAFAIKKHGALMLVVTCIGYEKHNEQITVEEGKTLERTIALRSISTKTGSVVVAASGYSSESGKGVVLKARDILTTPGGAADIFQALKTMPGLTQVSESAELFVRGGDPTETITLLDQASLYNPYTFESGFGGLFSNINTAAIRDLYFSSGGFSAKYGNALSGVLELSSKDEPASLRTVLGASLGNASLTSEIPLLDGRAGVTLNARHLLPYPLFFVNGGLERFTHLPVSRDASVGASWRYSSSGRIKLFGSFADDVSGVVLEQPGYKDEYAGASRSVFVNLQHSDVVAGSTVLKSSLSYSTSSNEQNIGAVNILRTDKTWKARSDAQIQLSSRFKLNTGAEFEHRTTTYNGTLPANAWNSQANAQKVVVAAAFAGVRVGGYAELEASEILGVKPLSVVAGTRYDALPELRLQWIDPRASIGWQIDERSSLKLGWGIFRQNPDPRLFARRTDNQSGQSGATQQQAAESALKPMQAAHYILSYDYAVNDNTTLRAEVFAKEYSHLPLQTASGGYESTGQGFARGVDVIAKGSIPAWNLSGWISYGFIDTKRHWMDFSQLAPSPFDITHNFTLIAKYDISAAWQIGINYRYATGRPFTPVERAVFHAAENVYEPVFGTKNSARYPDYHRLDFRATHLTQVFEKFVVVYVEALNILGINNMFGYAYSRDYTERTPITSYFGRRTIVVGASITL